MYSIHLEMKEIVIIIGHNSLGYEISTVVNRIHVAHKEYMLRDLTYLCF